MNHTRLLLNNLKRSTHRSQPLAVVIEARTALRFYPEGAFFQAIGHSISISKAIVN